MVRDDLRYLECVERLALQDYSRIVLPNDSTEPFPQEDRGLILRGAGSSDLSRRYSLPVLFLS